MKRLIGLILFAGLSACDPADNDQNPRDRVGSGGPLSWRLVEQSKGAAAFLSRPGAAPDLVLWCDGKGQITLRAHVFADPKPKPDLVLTTSGGQIGFEHVRRQGGVRASDRKLVEGQISLDRAGVFATILGASDLTLTSGGIDYKAVPADPDQVLPAFVTACTK
jgi:hypothetical protein